tara:strand:- start:120 stop:578 length:459 start_codon:yes stop_codon:yes gene_type:complete
MATYITTRCGHCNIDWEFLNRKRLNIKLGPPIVKCSSCLKLNKTKHKLYKDMTKFEKGWLIFSQTFLRAIVSIAFMLGGIWFIYNLWFGPDTEVYETGYGIGIFMSLLGVGWSYLGYKGFLGVFQLKESIESFENYHNKNGGFIWSYEYYNF